MFWKDDLWNEMRKVQRQMNKLFQRFEEPKLLSLRDEFGDNYRKAFMDYKENDKNFVIKVEIPGIDKEDIHLDVSEHSIVIRAEKKHEKKEGSKKEGNYSYSRSYAGFYQEVTLPENADKEKIDAVYKNGVLTLTIPKKKSSIKKKEIKIK